MSEDINTSVVPVTDFSAIMAQAAAAVVDIGGDIDVAPGLMYANVLQPNSPDIAAQGVRPGIWKFSMGDQARYVYSFGGILLDIIGAPGRAGDVNPAQRKMWSAVKDVENRAVYGSGPHCGSVDGVHPNPPFRTAYVQKGGLVDPRVPAGQVLQGQRGYNTPNDLIPFTHLVPIPEKCADCQLGRWLRTPDGSSAKPAPCSQSYKAVFYVTHVDDVEGSDVPAWEPRVVVFEGKGQTGRTFYSSARNDKEFQNRFKLAALYDQGFATNFAAKYGFASGSVQFVSPLIASVALVSNDEGQPFYVPLWANPTMRMSVNDTTEEQVRGRLAGFVAEITAARLPQGTNNRVFPTDLQRTTNFVGNSLLVPSNAEHVALLADIVAEFVEYWQQVNGVPAGRSRFTTYTAPAVVEPVETSTAPEIAPDAAVPSIPTAPSAQPLVIPDDPAWQDQRAAAPSTSAVGDVLDWEA